MKKCIIMVIACLLASMTFAQEQTQTMDDAARVEISAYIDNSSSIPNTARKVLMDKMQKAIIKNGLGATKNGRFIMTANVHELNLEKSETAPVIYIYNLEVSLYIGDGIEGTLFSSCSLEVSGAGDSKEKAYLATLKKITVPKDFIVKGKAKIVDYYNSKCDFIMKEALAKADRKEYDEAISMVVSIPSVCKECFDKGQEVSVEIYKRKIENDCQLNINQAKAAMAGNDWDGALGFLALYTPDLQCYPEVAKLMKEIHDHRCADALARAQSAWAARNAEEAASWLAEVSADSKCYPDAQALQKSIGSKMDADEQRNWDFMVQQHKDEVDIQKQAINAARDIGVAWGENQQPTYNILWW